MIVLSQITDKIVLSLGGAVTSNELHVYASWRERTSTTFIADRTAIESNGITDVIVVNNPSSSSAQRIIDYISIFNYDTVAQTVSVKFSDNGTDYFLFVGSIAAGNKVDYVEGSGWQQIAI